MKKNQQAPQPRLLSDGSRIQLHSIFSTIQGEGPFSGRPAVFVRLAGCNLQCPLCDTEYTAGATEQTAVAIAQTVANMRPRLIVVTGGEPLRQNITQLLDALHLETGAIVQIETNGHLPFIGWAEQDVRDRASWLHIVVSPKTHKVHPMLMSTATAFKYVVQHDAVMEADGLPRSALDHPIPGRSMLARPPLYYLGDIFIHPADEQDEVLNEMNLQAAAHTTLLASHRWPGARLGLQVHKYIDME